MKKKKKYETSLDSIRWLDMDNEFVTPCFTSLGFTKVGEFMNLRIFDLLNLNHIDNNRAEELLLTLYKFLNPNLEVDEDISLGFMDQYFDFTGWREKHKDPAKVTVEDLVMACDTNKKALLHIFDSITRAFYKPGEYNSHEYKYLNKSELDEEIKKRKGEK